MKVLFLILALTSLEFAVYAETPKIVAIRVANVLINNPDVAEKLKSENLSVTDLTIVEQSPGLTEFNFRLRRLCECVPKSGELRILQDLTPTYSDGKPKYTVELKTN